MADMRAHPEVITASFPNIELQCEIKYKNCDLSEITHVVAHLSNIRACNIMKSTTGGPCDPYPEEDALDFIGKMLSQTIFGNENQLEWLGAECHGRRHFVAFTNTPKKGKRVEGQGLGIDKFQVIEAMFVRPNSQEKQKVFWRPAREVICQKVAVKAKNAVEMVRIRVVGRFDAAPPKTIKN
ncbi:hypothetical protein N7457_008873 [Penicillium paradoxum]|uniref:uncharacterized protein n=1 Tax=Penicillium paradoxum TaxID=176176 RepID=UPI0025479002|nr:uncharacterized protein N7457_008873 [Penicillium paradoxum]KAJ5773977.1 hypothetical protein N7457_008873 [Penicillium paradoxum]